jgi:hypothetical protein
MALCTQLRSQTIDKSYGQYKQVTKRTIRMADSVDIPDAASFTELLYKAALAGNIKAYATWNDPFETQFTRQELIDAIDGKPKIQPTPAANKKGPAKAPYKPPVHHFGIVKKMKFMEEWTMNKWDGTTSCRIIGIAPMQDIYGEDGNYRGPKSLFWVRYDEAFPILNSYAVNYPDNNPLNAYWGDLQSDSMGTLVMKPEEILLTNDNASAVWKKKTLYKITFRVRNDDALKHFYNMTEDKVLFEYLSDQVLNGTTRLFDGNANTMTKPITNGEAKAMMVPPPNDTMESVDPVTGNNVVRVIKHTYRYDFVNDFLVLQDCSFDRAKGLTTMHIEGLMPLENTQDARTYKEGLKRYFWINFDDKIKQIVQNYASLNPHNDMLLNLWDDYFKRPE